MVISKQEACRMFSEAVEEKERQDALRKDQEGAEAYELVEDTSIFKDIMERLTMDIGLLSLRSVHPLPDSNSTPRVQPLITYIGNVILALEYLGYKVSIVSLDVLNNMADTTREKELVERFKGVTYSSFLVISGWGVKG